MAKKKSAAKVLPATNGKKPKEVNQEPGVIHSIDGLTVPCVKGNSGKKS